MDTNVTYIIIYSKQTFVQMLVKFEHKIISIFKDIAFKLNAPIFFNLHRYWIIGNWPQPMHILNVRYLKINESTQTLSRPLNLNNSPKNIRFATFQQNYNNLKTYNIIYINSPFIFKGSKNMNTP